eukprot:TRINITY_DN14289_c0_g1_i1.p1 TRINITY_DN14289_c0_g1~~TRINITY_DN14289_c0_g1_i1.p1  ORF type:complete len:762 (-),score=184.90 TRINITY_DN14289_c0_g1_i1:97-2382(-)
MPDGTDSALGNGLAAAAAQAEADMEADDAVGGDSAATASVDVGLEDMTVNTLWSAHNQIATSVGQFGFGHLLAGARTNVGAKGGRYLFEAVVLETVPSADAVFRIGFSTAGSSLLLADGSADSMCFDSDGTWHAPEPWQEAPVPVPRACSRLVPGKVVGLLLNIEQELLSVFIDGKRAGSPQVIPVHLRGKALYPTVTFKNATVQLNFGRFGQKLAALPFKCSTFCEITQAHQERQPARAPEREVILPIGLPQHGFTDIVDRLKLDRASEGSSGLSFEEISIRRLREWCQHSGLAADQTPNLQDMLPKFERLVRAAGRSCILAEQRLSLSSSERSKAMQRFAGYKKSAIVAIGEPSVAFKQGTINRLNRQWEAEKAAVEKRKAIAEASGESLPPIATRLRPQPKTDNLSFPLKTDADMSEEQVLKHYSRFSLPTKGEDGMNVDFVWDTEEAGQELLRKFVLKRKATSVVPDLKPGPWFLAKWQEYQKMRQALQTKHKAFKEKEKAAAEQHTNADADEEEEGPPPPPLKAGMDIHNADGQGTPIYGQYTYTDWCVLDLNLRLHLMATAFAKDVNDSDRPGIPQDHVSHYWGVYYDRPLQPTRYGPKASSVPALVKMLKGPCKLGTVEGQLSLILQSTLPADTELAEFVIEVEKFRRDRARRVEAGDESASLVIPRLAAQPKEAAVAKAAPATAAIAKQPAVRSLGAATGGVKRPHRPEDGADAGPGAKRVDTKQVPGPRVSKPLPGSAKAIPARGAKPGMAV